MNGEEITMCNSIKRKSSPCLTISATVPIAIISGLSKCSPTFSDVSLDYMEDIRWKLQRMIKREKRKRVSQICMDLMQLKLQHFIYTLGF